MMSVLNRIAGKLRIWRQQYQDLGPRNVALWLASDGLRWVAGAPLRRYSQLTPQLHLGGQHCRRGWPRLTARGITAVVSMRAEFDDSSSGIAPSRYLHLPTVDDQAPSLRQLQAGVAFIAKEIAGGGSVYVHCRSGTGRAATMAAAYLAATGLTGDDAWAQIRKVRPFVCPTPAQAAQVEHFSSGVGKRGHA